MDPMLSMVVEHHLKTTMHYPNVTDVKLIYQTTLTASDVNDSQSRFAMPRNQILTPFLTQSEDLYLQWKTKDGANIKIPLNVVVGSTEYKLSLSRWNYYDPDKHEHKKDNNNDTNNNNRNKKRKRSDNNENDDKEDNEEKTKKKKSYRWKYVVKGGWNQLKADNHLQSGDVIQVVSFRSHNHDIGLVILHTPRPLDLNIIPAI